MFKALLHGTASYLATATAALATATAAPTRRRSFDGAASSRRWAGTPRMVNVAAEALAAGPIIRGRSNQLVRNHPYAANGVEAWVSHGVGTGIVPTAQHPDEGTRKVLQRTFARWTPHADADQVLDFYGLQALVMRQLVVDGEVFIHLQVVQTPAGAELRLQLIDAELVDGSHTLDLPTGGRIVAGVEFDPAGRRVAYHVARRRPTDAFATTLPPVRISAADVLHVFSPLVPGQVRGLPWTAPVLLRLRDLDALEDALLLRQQIAALHAGFIVDPNADPAASPFGTDDASFPTLEPGTMQSLPPGTDVRFSTPGEASEGVPFVASQLRAIAAGLGVPEHLLTGDLSQANYSSLRAAMVQFRRRVEAVQYSILIHQFCRPVWERFVTLAVLSGALDAPDFENRTDDYLSCEWFPPAQPWIDPLKDAEAEALAIASGLKSRRQAVAERGYDIETLDAEIAADRVREAALGLDFTAPTKATPDA